MLWLVLVLQASTFASPSQVAARPWFPPPALVDRMHDIVPAGAPAPLRLRLLHRHLVSSSGLGIRQVSGWSGSSAEVSRLKRADCVGFAYLYGGLARQLGLATGFAVIRPDVSARPKPTRLRGLGVREAHVVVTFRGRHDELWAIDFSGVRRAGARPLLALRDDEAAALLWSNRVARALQRGDCGDAWRYARLAGGRLAALTGDLPRVLNRFCAGHNPRSGAN